MLGNQNLLVLGIRILISDTGSHSHLSLGEVLLLEVWWQLLLLLMLKVRLERELLIEENWLLSHSNLRWLHVLLLLHCGLLRGHLIFFFQQKKQFKFNSRLSKAEMNFCRGRSQKKKKKECVQVLFSNFT